jgi:hypothetical protein
LWGGGETNKNSIWYRKDQRHKITSLGKKIIFKKKVTLMSGANRKSSMEILSTLGPKCLHK